MRIVGRFAILAGCVAASTAAFAANPWEPGGPLDACLSAVVAARPGIITKWRQTGGREQPLYEVGVLTEEGKIWETTCDPAAVEKMDFNEKAGVYRYGMYERAKWPETKARESAPEIFVGPAVVIGMELNVSFTGKPSYQYQLILPKDYRATVEIDAVYGKLIHAEVKF